MKFIKASFLLFFFWILFFDMFGRTFSYSDSCAGNDGKFTIDDLSGITTVLWDFGDLASGALNSSTLVSPVHSFTNNGDFTVKLTINGSEVVTNSIHITYKFTGSSTLAYMCKGITVSLDCDSSKKAKHYLWVNGETTQIISLRLSRDTNFYAWIYDNHECRAKSSFILKAIAIKPDFNIDQPNQCLLGNSFAFTNSTNTTNRPWITFKWSFGDGNNDINRDAAHIYSSAGAFPVQLIATPKDTFVCADTITRLVNVFNRVIPSFEYDVNRCKNTVSFINTSDPAQNFLWDFGNGERYPIKDTTIKYPGNGKYTVKLYSNLTTSCIDSVIKEIEITVADSLIFIPDAFSPNNDGLNDSFKVVGLDYECFTYKLLIYSRWGELIFDSESKVGEPVWNGTFKSKRVAQGVYFFVVLGRHFTKWGSVTVLP